MVNIFLSCCSNNTKRTASVAPVEDAYIIGKKGRTAQSELDDALKFLETKTQEQILNVKTTEGFILLANDVPKKLIPDAGNGAPKITVNGNNGKPDSKLQPRRSYSDTDVKESSTKERSRTLLAGGRTLLDKYNSEIAERIGIKQAAELLNQEVVAALKEYGGTTGESDMMRKDNNISSILTPKSNNIAMTNAQAIIEAKQCARKWRRFSKNGDKVKNNIEKAREAISTDVQAVRLHQRTQCLVSHRRNFAETTPVHRRTEEIRKDARTASVTEMDRQSSSSQCSNRSNLSVRSILKKTQSNSSKGSSQSLRSSKSVTFGVTQVRHTRTAKVRPKNTLFGKKWLPVTVHEDQFKSIGCSDSSEHLLGGCVDPPKTRLKLEVRK